jgi:hypothetical protein
MVYMSCIYLVLTLHHLQSMDTDDVPLTLHANLFKE